MTEVDSQGQVSADVNKRKRKNEEKDEEKKENVMKNMRILIRKTVMKAILVRKRTIVCPSSTSLQSHSTIKLTATQTESITEGGQGGHHWQEHAQAPDAVQVFWKKKADIKRESQTGEEEVEDFDMMTCRGRGWFRWICFTLEWFKRWRKGWGFFLSVNKLRGLLFCW